MNRHKQRFSVQTIFRTLVLIALLLVFSVNFYYYLRMLQLSDQKVNEYAKNITTQANLSVQDVFKENVTILNHVANIKTVQDFLTFNDQYERFKLYRYLNDMLNTIVQSNKKAQNLMIYSKAGKLVHYYDYVPDAVSKELGTFFADLSEKAPSFCSFEVYGMNYIAGIMPVRSLDLGANNGKILGYVVSIVAQNSILALLPQENTVFFDLIDETDRRVLTNLPMDFADKLSSSDFLIQEDQPVTYTNFKIRTIANLQSTRKESVVPIV